MSTVAVTGCSGYIGRKVCELLEKQDAVSRVVGVDVREPSFSTRNLEFYRMDVRSPDLAVVLAGCDAVVHLAAAGGREAAGIIVGGTRAVTRAAREVGAAKLVFTSSVLVYGAHRDNASLLTEDSPLRPAPRGYAAANVEAEEAARAFAFESRVAVVTILRLGAVSGPSLPAAPIVAGPGRGSGAPPFQALHEDDAARAIVHALNHTAAGTFNVAADDVVERPSELIGAPDSLQRLTERVFPMDVAPDPYPIVVSSERFKATGFEFSFTSSDALRAGASARKGWVSVGGVRFRPSWVAAAAGSIAALAIGSAARAASRRAKT